MDRELMLEQIIEKEWQAFTTAPNQGGRAPCQDDPETFFIMRRSQYMTWDDALLESWLADICAAEQAGWNVMTEKYARMEESLDPARYDEIRHMLPQRSDTHRAVAEQIVQIQVGWMEAFAAEYPKFAGRARNIHTAEDTRFATSYETYLRAELGTYSDNTLMLYGRLVVSLYRDGKNLARMIMENTAKLYGYADLDAAEKAI